MTLARLVFILTLGSGVLTLPLSAQEALPVTTATVTTRDSGVELVLTGVIEAEERILAGFANPGQVLAVYPQAGSLVKAGDLLAEQDPTQAREALRAAQAALAAARAALLREEREIARDRELAGRGYVSNAQLDLAEQGLMSARAAVRQAEASVDGARKRLAETQLLAASDAVVLARKAEAGQVVGAAQSVLELAGLSGREAVFVAPADYDLSDLPGQKLTLRTLDLPERLVQAEITQVAPMIDPGTGGIRVRARLIGITPADVMLNEAVEGRLSLGRDRAAELPARALVRGAEGPAVWVVQPDGTAALRPVVLSHYSSASIFVAGGLAEGEEVVIEGAAQLFAGRQVAVIPAPHQPQE